jgi:hypothetical protein
MEEALLVLGESSMITLELDTAAVMAETEIEIEARKKRPSNVIGSATRAAVRISPVEVNAIDALCLKMTCVP